MIEKWLRRMGWQPSAPDAQAQSVSLERVSVTLLIEIARSDHEIDASERAAISRALVAAGSLSATEIDNIIDTAVQQADSQVSLHEHIRAVNDHVDYPERVALIEQMWRVAYADGDLDKYEEYTIRKLTDLLYVNHRDFIQAKLRVLEATSSAS